MLLSWGRANFGANHFENPEEVRLDRAITKDPVGFGGGGHRFVGTPFARLEIKAVHRAVLRRLRNFRVLRENVVYADHIAHSRSVLTPPFVLTGG